MKLEIGQKFGRWHITQLSAYRTILTRHDVDGLDFEFFERQVWHKTKKKDDKIQEIIELTQKVEDDIGYKRGQRELKESFHKLMKLDESTSN